MDKTLSGQVWMRKMTNKMQKNPQKRMQLVGFSFCVIYSEDESPKQICIVCNNLYKLYKKYADEYATTNDGTTINNDMQENQPSYFAMCWW
ncbi:hypothetical protein GQ457_16G012080 [Hibiscus cannabinus]